MIRGRTIWDQTDGFAKQYRCSISYQLMSYLSKSYQIVLDSDVDKPGHGKDVVDGFNAVQKQYLATCLRIRSTPEKDKIDSKRMRVEAMTEKGEVSFAEECKRLMDLRDEIGTKGNKKHAKREAKARLKHKYYWIHKEEDTLFSGMKAVYKILNNKDKVSMKILYHIRCNLEWAKVSVLCGAHLVLVIDVWSISPNPGYLTRKEHNNHVMLSNQKHVSTLQYYMAIINGILPNWVLKKKQQPQTR